MVLAREPADERFSPDVVAQRRQAERHVRAMLVEIPGPNYGELLEKLAELNALTSPPPSPRFRRRRVRVHLAVPPRG